MILRRVASFDNDVENGEHVQKQIVEMYRPDVLNQIAHAAHNVEKLSQHDGQKLLIEQGVHLLDQLADVGSYVEIVEDVPRQIALTVDDLQLGSENVGDGCELK